MTKIDKIKHYTKNTKPIDFELSKKLYTEVLLTAAGYLKKAMPADVVECMLAGPGGKYPILISTFIVTLRELTGRSFVKIIEAYTQTTIDVVPVSQKWHKYVKDCKGMEHDVAMICTILREKYCNNNKPYE